MLRGLISLVFLLFIWLVKAQIQDDFSDGNLNQDPFWISTNISSNGTDFVVLDGELNTNGPKSAATIFISTPLSLLADPFDLTWEFYVRYDNPPSNSNYVKIYLLSDQSDLTGNPRGYYLRMGVSGSADGIDLYNSELAAPLIADSIRSIANSIDCKVRVSRSWDGQWTLSVAFNESLDYQVLGSAMDQTMISSGYFGFFVQHSGSRNQAYFFDDIAIGFYQVVDEDPPMPMRIEVLSETEILIHFDETILSESIYPENFTINGDIQVKGAQLMESGASVKLLTDSLQVAL